jgi:hypothetical protein
MPGKLCPGNYFMCLQGLLRQYYINAKLNEQIVQFALESWWIADQDSLLNNKPSTVTYIQTIEATEALLLNEKNREMLFEKIPRSRAISA